eukprot:8965645-Pyramimonas_sp.AAC.1
MRADGQEGKTYHVAMTPCCLFRHRRYTCVIPYMSLVVTVPLPPSRPTMEFANPQLFLRRLLLGEPLGGLTKVVKGFLGLSAGLLVVFWWGLPRATQLPIAASNRGLLWVVFGRL